MVVDGEDYCETGFWAVFMKRHKDLREVKILAGELCAQLACKHVGSFSI